MYNECFFDKEQFFSLRAVEWGRSWPYAISKELLLEPLNRRDVNYVNIKPFKTTPRTLTAPNPPKYFLERALMLEVTLSLKTLILRRECPF